MLMSMFDLIFQFYSLYFKYSDVVSFHQICAAVEFLRCTPEGKYDAIIVDSSDPVGMSFHFYC